MENDIDCRRPDVMFHGTSGIFLDALLAAGLSGSVGDDMKTSARLDTLGHLGSLPGVYLAADLDLAISHAENACKVHGGEPVIIGVRVDPSATVPDEDHVLEFLGNYGEDLGRFFDLGGFLDRWRTDTAFRDTVAVTVAAALQHHFSPTGTSGLVPSVLGMLRFAFDGMTPDQFEAATSSRGSVLSPSILEPGMEAEGGVARYRELMDALCRSMTGTGPYDDLQNHSVRVPGDIGYAGPVRIVTAGTPEDLTASYRGEIDRTVTAVLEGWGWEEVQPAP